MAEYYLRFESVTSPFLEKYISICQGETTAFEAENDQDAQIKAQERLTNIKNRRQVERCAIEKMYAEFFLPAKFEIWPVEKKNQS